MARKKIIQDAFKPFQQPVCGCLKCGRTLGPAIEPPGDCVYSGCGKGTAKNFPTEQAFWTAYRKLRARK